MGRRPQSALPHRADRLSVRDFSFQPGSRTPPNATAWSPRHSAAGRQEHARTKKPSARELPLVRRRIAALLDKTEANGCTPGEAAAAFEKAEELVAKYKLDPDAFRWPPKPSTPFGSARSGPGASKSPQAAASSRGRGIGKLAELLIVEHPDWTYRRIAEEVNARIEGAAASEKSVRWYASQMRKRGDGILGRRKKQA